MFPGSDLEKGKNVKIQYKHVVSLADGVGVESQLISEGLNEAFFNKNGVPIIQKPHFLKLKL